MILDAPILPSAAAVSTSVMTIIPEAWRSVAQLASPVCYPRGRDPDCPTSPPTDQPTFARSLAGSEARIALSIGLGNGKLLSSRARGARSRRNWLGNADAHRFACVEHSSAFVACRICSPWPLMVALRFRSGPAVPLRHLQRRAAYSAEFPRLRAIRQSLRRLTISRRLGVTSAS